MNQDLYLIHLTIHAHFSLKVRILNIQRNHISSQSLNQITDVVSNNINDYGSPRYLSTDVIDLDCNRENHAKAGCIKGVFGLLLSG